MWPIVLLHNRPTVRPYPAQVITLHMSRNPGLGQRHRSYITREQGHGMCMCPCRRSWVGALFTCRDLYCIWIDRIIWVNNESVLSRVNSHIDLVLPKIHHILTSFLSLRMILTDEFDIRKFSNLIISWAFWIFSNFAIRFELHNMDVVMLWTLRRHYTRRARAPAWTAKKESKFFLCVLYFEYDFA